MSTVTSLLACSPFFFIVAFTWHFLGGLLCLVGSTVLMSATLGYYVLCIAALTVCIGAFLCCLLICSAAFAVFSSLCISIHFLNLSLLSSWFFVSMVAIVGMELLCFISAMTNPEVGLILYDNVDERRYRLGAAAGFLEDFPGFILQAYYTHLMGVRGTAGTSRAISLALSSWRMFVLTVKRFIKLRMIARDKRQSKAPESWNKEKEILTNSHGVTTMILFHFRSSLFPDAFSAVLRVVVFSMYTGFFGWLASQNMYTQGGFSAYVDSNFPVPTNVCPQQSSFVLCDLSAQCKSGECSCNIGFGGDGFTCTPFRPGSCGNATTGCNYPAICQNLPSGGFTCPCPSWTTSPKSGVAFSGTNDACSCASPLFPIPDVQKGACSSRTRVTEGEVAAIMICGVCVPIALMFLAHWKWTAAKGNVYDKKWKIGFIASFLAIFSLILGLLLGLRLPSSPQMNAFTIASSDRKAGKMGVPVEPSDGTRGRFFFFQVDGLKRV